MLCGSVRERTNIADGCESKTQSISQQLTGVLRLTAYLDDADVLETTETQKKAVMRPIYN